MSFDSLVFYIEACIICIVILSMLLINDRMNSTQQEAQACFNRVIVSLIAYFVSDVCLAAVLGGVVPGIRFFTGLVWLTNYVFLGIVAYEWFMFVAASEKMPFRNSRKKKRLCFLPVIVSTLYMMVTYAADPRFWISEKGEVNRWHYSVLAAVPALYLLASFIISMINARKAELKEEKKTYCLFGILPLGVGALGLIQAGSMNAPTFCFACTLVLLFFYIQHMQAMISVDALTNLNNRGQINRYMDQVHYKTNSRVFIMMIDIDRFKQINDTYGHAEGDRALVLVSEALKKICRQVKAFVFLGRYGGDEFTLIIHNPGENEFPKQIAKSIRNALCEIQTEHQLPYSLEISIGYDELKDGDDTMGACLICADKMLYRDKRKRARRLAY